MEAMKCARLTVVLAALLLACKSDSDDDKPKAGPPPKITDHPACVISADCPAGQHCDLGECVQSCNQEEPCSAALSCTSRARCVPPDSKDEDPAPTTTYLGAITASPTLAPLTDADKTLEIELKSSGSEPVRYRIELNAPHLRVAELRGEFTGSRKITFNVDVTTLKGRDVPGSIKFFTSLGDTVITAPIHVGLTGAYHGAMRYDGGAVPLGDARLAFEMIENKGELSVRVDAKQSLLFPTTDAGEATGRGSFTVSEGLDFTIAQRIPKTFATDRNRFDRDVGRKVRFKLKPTSRGDLEGTFEETLYGLFSLPVTLTGTVAFQYVARGSDPEFTVGEAPTMPPSPTKDVFKAPNAVFKWDTATCETEICSSGCADATATKAKVSDIDTAYAKVLETTVGAKSEAKPFTAIADACKLALAKTNVDSWLADSVAKQCSLPPKLACTLPVLAKLPTTDTAAAKLFGRLTYKVLAAPLLVAKNEIVLALSDSFASGGAKEKSRYDDAMTTLAPAATWVLQPAVLEYLRSMSSEAAKGDDPGDGTTLNEPYPAARALADLFQTAAALDGERARIGAAASADAQPALAVDAQRRAVLTYLEAAALTEILRSWSSAPKSISVKLLGVLTPIDEGFGALNLGANAFGVPSGFVPFVYRPEDVAKGATNFEQMLSIAKDSVGTEASVESAFTTNKRTYELNNKDLQSQLTNVRSQFDLRLKDLCGGKIEPDLLSTNTEWMKCGSPPEYAGEIGTLMLDIEQAAARLRSAESRIRGMRDKIDIDTRRLADSQAVRADTLAFVDTTGKKLAANSFATGVIDAVSSAIQTSSNANLLNFGTPIAQAAVVAVLGTVKAGLDAQKVQLQTAQTMKFEENNAKVELINGMAEIKKLTIDLAQLGVDMQQDVVAMVQAQARVRSAIGIAHATYEERARVLGILGKDPSNDPSYRLLRDQQALRVLKARADAQKQLFLAGSALQYEINTKLPALDGAILNAHNAESLLALQNCFTSIFNGHRVAFGAPQDYVATVSVRRMLGITGPRVDSVTGATLTEGDQFRMLLLRNQNLDGSGGVGITFSTNLQPGNQLWSTDVCSDRVSTIQAQIVGDFLGDNQAQVNLSMSGGSFMRKCDSDVVEPWSLGPPGSSASAFAVIQSGVNTFGDSTPNTSLFGQSVARSDWKIVIPGPSGAPPNSDLDVTKIEDIVLKIGHKALPRKSTPIAVDYSCLASIGK